MNTAALAKSAEQNKYALYVPLEGADFAQKALTRIEAAVEGDDHDEEISLLLDSRTASWSRDSTIQSRMLVWGLRAYGKHLTINRAVIVSPDFLSHQYVRFMTMLDSVWNNAILSTFTSPEEAVDWLSSDNSAYECQPLALRTAF
jgi:hypothetical protein